MLAVVILEILMFKNVDLGNLGQCQGVQHPE